jgi:hypothetical protein
MKLGVPAASRLESGGTAVACDIATPDGPRQVYFNVGEHLGAGEVGVDAFVCLGVVPAMRVGREITCSTPVSPRLAAALPKIQQTFAKWYPQDLTPVRLVAPLREERTLRPTRGVGCSFSGGVDSFYSILRHSDEIDTLIFAHGFDVPLGNTELRRRVSGQLQQAAAALGKRLVELETNAREFLDAYGNWGAHTHGAALAAVAHVLSPLLRKVYIPSTYTGGDLFPWGTHPVVDPLWTSEDVEIVHDDDGATRVAKTFALAGSDVAMSHLRVCWENRDNAYNCGQCEKCLRTMLTLRLAGALDRCRTFAVPFDLDRVSRLVLTSDARRRFYQELLAAAKQCGDRDAAAVVEQVLRRRGHVKRWLARTAGGLRRRVLGW